MAALVAFRPAPLVTTAAAVVVAVEMVLAAVVFQDKALTVAQVITPVQVPAAAALVE